MGHSLAGFPFACVDSNQLCSSSRCSARRSNSGSFDPNVEQKGSWQKPGRFHSATVSERFQQCTQIGEKVWTVTVCFGRGFNPNLPGKATFSLARLDCDKTRLRKNLQIAGVTSEQTRSEAGRTKKNSSFANVSSALKREEYPDGMSVRDGKLFGCELSSSSIFLR